MSGSVKLGKESIDEIASRILREPGGRGFTTLERDLARAYAEERLSHLHWKRKAEAVKQMGILEEIHWISERHFLKTGEKKESIWLSEDQKRRLSEYCRENNVLRIPCCEPSEVMGMRIENP